MAKKQSKDILLLLQNAFTPIVLNDKDIQEFIAKNELDGMETKLIVYWLVSAAAGFYLAASNDPKYESVIQHASRNLAFVEEKLSPKYDNIHSILDSVLKDNIVEWFEIIKKDLQKENIESKDSDNINNVEDPDKIIAFYQKALFPIVIREDDVTEFADQFEPQIGNLIVNFICLLTLLKWATKLATDEKKPDEPFARNSIEIAQSLMVANSKLFDAVESLGKDAQRIEDGVKEIVNDHVNEFVKKMYKALLKQANN